MMTPDAIPTDKSDTAYDPNAIFREDGPIDPRFVADQIQALMRAHPLDTSEPRAAQQRHLEASIIALAASNPRDPIEVMLGVQAVSAYQAACVCWRIAANGREPDKDRIRHITAAATAARTFDTMLRALERRQAKPLSVPVGRPACGTASAGGVGTALNLIADRIRVADVQQVDDLLAARPRPAVDPVFVWSPTGLAVADRMMERDRIEMENEGLDIANTEGILPGGGMIVMDNPTPQQEAYMARRLALMYRREYQENLDNGIKLRPKIHGIRSGDLIP